MGNRKNQILDNIKESIEEYWIENNEISFNSSNPKINLHEPTFGPDIWFIYVIY